VGKGGCRVWLGRGVKRAKRTQFGPAGTDDGRNCAKRSQTWENWGMWAKAVLVWAVARPGSETCKTNPIWPSWRRMPEANTQNEPNFGQMVGVPRSESCKTNPILPERPGMGAGWRGRDVPPECDCAKRTQFRPRRKMSGGDVQQSVGVPGSAALSLRRSKAVCGAHPTGCRRARARKARSVRAGGQV
jgi:hypothetical protein